MSTRPRETRSLRGRSNVVTETTSLEPDGRLAGAIDLAASAPNFEGSIVGRALYAGRFTLEEALAAVSGATDG